MWSVKNVCLAAVAFLAFLFPQTARANAVTDWNEVMDGAIKTAQLSPAVQGRYTAIVESAVFDAVNGITQKYRPYHVTPSASPGSRPEAAAIQAAYTALVGLFPTQKTDLDARLAASLSEIPGSSGNSQSILRGRQWGEQVAQAILDWRSQDGFNTTVPPYFGGTAVGQWRSVPDGDLPGIFPQVGTMTPFAIQSHDQFRPGPPPALGSPEYAAALNEVKELGAVNSTTRTPLQTDLARLWQATDLADENRAIQAVVPAKYDLTDTARLFALVNIAFGDATIYGMDAKYTYGLWRPYHAIRFADTDGNPLTEADPTWTALILAPRHPEYPSNHACITGAGMRMLSHLLGDNTPLTIRSTGLPGVSRTYPNFRAVADEAGFARIWAGIHYRFSMNTGQQGGFAVADYIFDHQMKPVK
jgi:hypothetical protein